MGRRNKPIIIQSYPDPKNFTPNITYNYKDLTGMTFGWLKVICRWAASVSLLGIKEERPYWVCRCKCGNLCVASTKALCKHGIVSCGCYHRTVTAKYINRTHGLSNTRVYDIYNGILKRCYNKNAHNYPDYGGRGIVVCDEWYTPGVKGNPGFLTFYNWSMENGYSDELSIDRIDVDGPYAPWNCRWATDIDQENNRRNTKFILDFDGTEISYANFERKYNLRYETVRRQLRNGWSNSEILYTATHPELGMHKSGSAKTIIDSDGFLHMIPRVSKRSDNH